MRLDEAHLELLQHVHVHDDLADEKYGIGRSGDDEGREPRGRLLPAEGEQPKKVSQLETKLRCASMLRAC